MPGFTKPKEAIVTKPNVEKDHNSRRTVWIEIVLTYGLFIALAIWNWW
jgi:hypothetical protein